MNYPFLGCPNIALILLLLLLLAISPLTDATILPRVSPSQNHHGGSYFRRLLDIPFGWASGSKPRKGLNQWLHTHPKLLANLQRYENEVVIRFNISTDAHEAALRKAVDQMLLDVWDFTDNYTDIRLDTRRIRPLMGILPPSMQDNHSILISDLSRAVADTYPTNVPAHSIHQSTPSCRGITPANDTPLPKRRGADDIFFHDYQPLSVVYPWMKLLDSMFRNRGLVRMISIGKSYEGRDILGLRIGIPSNDASARDRKDTILMTGGIHAREWISTSTVNYVAWSFIRSIDEDPMIAKILKHFDIVFIPVLNPDGYEYTWEVDRLWRKSRQRTKMQYCPGFDLDHTFGYQWDTTQHQTEPCSESYGGDEPFQAVEAVRLADWARNETENGVKFVGYLDLHSYSQQVLYPYAYSCATRPPNMENLEEVAMNLAKHMRLSNGEVYTTTSACEGAVASEISTDNMQGPQRARVEARGGSAIDYIFHEFKAHYSYQIKLRDTGSYGFLLPSEHIIPTGEEVYQAMKYFGDYLLGNNGHESMGHSIPTEDHINQVDLTVEEEVNMAELRKRRRRRCDQCTY